MDELSPEDKLTVFRARKIQKFLSQLFTVAEVFTNVPGKQVPVEETVRLRGNPRRQTRRRSGKRLPLQGLHRRGGRQEQGPITPIPQAQWPTPSNSKSSPQVPSSTRRMSPWWRCRGVDMGIYPNHVPLMIKVAAGEVEVTRDGKGNARRRRGLRRSHRGSRINPHRHGRTEAEIDEAKAEEALKAAEDRLKGESLSDEQVIAAEAAAAAALAQLKVKR